MMSSTFSYDVINLHCYDVINILCYDVINIHCYEVINIEMSEVNRSLQKLHTTGIRTIKDMFDASSVPTRPLLL